MTTINGVTFNMKTLELAGTHRNIPNEEIGGDVSYITDMGYSGLVLRLIGFEKTIAKYDEVINEFMKPGGHALVHRTDWQFTIYSTYLVPTLDMGIVDNFFPYEMVMRTSTPYRESTSTTERSKTITTNPQSWTQDDSTNDIDTDGIVDAVPDITVTGGAVASTARRISTVSSINTDATEYSDGTDVWVLKKTHTFTAISYLAHRLDTVGLDLKDSSSYNSYGKVTYQVVSLNGGAETDVPGASWTRASTSYGSYSVTDLDILCAANEDLVVRFYLKSTLGSTAYFKNLDYDITNFRKDVCKNPLVYNTADTTIKCSVANEIEPDMVFLINTDGTGTIEYIDDFTTDKYLDAHWEKSGVTRDGVNYELDIADDGYITYKMDTKNPITGIPTLTSFIDITAGTPTIQISSDGSTWYDIDTAIVDYVNTAYSLDSSSLNLKGLTVFYWRIDCTDTGTHTCSIKSFDLDIVIHTIDVEHPTISSTGVSTFRCDQDSDSGIDCEIALTYRHRSWPT